MTDQPDPALFRWSPANHYDAAIELLAASDSNANLVIAHAVLGILRRLDEYTP